MPTFQEQLNGRQQEKAEETVVLLRNQYTTFTEAHSMLIQYVSESVVTTDVLRSWDTYYGHVFEEM